jgi:hypothetical protein
MIGLRLGFSIVERVEGRWNLEGMKKREINLVTAVFLFFFSHTAVSYHTNEAKLPR